MAHLFDGFVCFYFIFCLPISIQFNLQVDVFLLYIVFVRTVEQNYIAHVMAYSAW